MGKKKRTSRVNPPTSPATTTVDAASDQDILAIEDHPALSAIRRGNHKKALEMIKPPLLSSHPHSPILHCIAAVTHRHLAAKATQGSHKEFKHLTEAARSAESAWEVFPNSVQVASFLCSLLHRLAMWDDARLDKVIQVCNQALNIENSTDPRILEKLLDKDETTNVKQRIKNLLQESEHKKNLSLAKKKQDEDVNREIEEKKEIVLLREAFIRVKRIKKQIVETVNALRQTTSYNCHVKKLIDNFAKQWMLKRFWATSLKAEKKRVFLQVKIVELESYLKLLKFRRAVELLDEALRFAKEHKTWKFFECCDCPEKFVDHDLYRGHCRIPNLGQFESNFQSFIRGEIKREWINMIVNCVWKPIDTDVAIRMMGSTVDSSLCTEKDLGECKDSSVEDVQETISEEASVQDLVGSKKDENVSSKTSMNDPKWPICDDPERERILERIRGIFLFLLNNNFLSPSLVHWAIQHTIHVFDDNILSSKFRCHGLESPEIICFLGASKLEELYNLLKGLAHSCDLREDSEMDRSMDVDFSGHQMLDIKEEVVFSGDFSCLLLDERLLTGELNISNYFDAVANAGSAVTDAVDVGVNRYNSLSDGSEIVPWLYQQPRHRIEENLKSWSSLIDSQKAKAKEVLGIVLQECSHLQTAVNIISELSIKREATCAVNSSFLEDPKDKEAKMQLFRDMAFADSIILRLINLLRKFRLILEKLSTADYRAIIVPLLKLFLQTQLEDLLDEDTKENFSAIDEDLLATNESDAVKNTNKGFDNVGQKQSNKKKKGNFRKAKDSKANEQPLIHQDDTEQVDHSTGVPVIAEENIKQKEILYDSSSKSGVKTKNGLNEETSQGDSGSTFGVGLKNVGENSCFLNVIIQSLWHLEEFRTNFMFEAETHAKHVRDECVVCALDGIFDQLSTASRNNQRQAVSSTVLRKALSYLHPNRFQMEAMHDASEAWAAIFSSLHRWFTFGSDDPIVVSRANCNDSSKACLLHKYFGMKVTVEAVCDGCSNKDIHISDMVNLKTDELRKQKSIKEKFSFDDAVTDALQNMATDQINVACLSDGGHSTHEIVLVPLNVITIALHWITGYDSKEEISETLNCLSTELHIGAQGSDRRKQYSLISMVCYLRSQQHYYCFIYNHKHRRCFLYDDAYVKDFGCWDDVSVYCIEECIRPVALTFKNTQLEGQFDKGTAEKSDAAIKAPPAENKAMETCTAEKNKMMGESVGENLGEGLSAISSKDCEDEYEKKFQADIEKAVRLSLEKSDSAVEAPPAELSLDEEKNVHKICDNVRETKVKEKNKSFQKDEEFQESVGKNLGEGVSAISSNDCEDEYEKKFLADIEKAVCLSLEKNKKIGESVGENLGEGVSATSSDDVARWRDECTQIILDRIDQLENQHHKLRKEVREMNDKVSEMNDEVKEMKDKILKEVRELNDKISKIFEHTCN